MIQISDNAGKQIRKLLEKQGMAAGGLRVGVKARRLFGPELRLRLGARRTAR